MIVVILWCSLKSRYIDLLVQLGSMKMISDDDIYLCVQIGGSRCSVFFTEWTAGKETTDQPPKEATERRRSCSTTAKGVAWLDLSAPTRSPALLTLDRQSKIRR